MTHLRKNTSNVDQFPSLDRQSAPCFDQLGCARLDRELVSSYGANILCLMELAGFLIADLARAFLGGSLSKKNIVFCVGKGNNGGDAIVASRFLSSWGAQITLILPDDLSSIGKTQMKTLQNRAITQIRMNDSKNAEIEKGLESADLIVDGVLGFGISGPVRDAYKPVIAAINLSQTPCLAIDVPSGIHATSGPVNEIYVRPALTLALSALKNGLFTTSPPTPFGALYLGDIGVPFSLYQSLGFMGPYPFDGASIFRII